MSRTVQQICFDWLRRSCEVIVLALAAQLASLLRFEHPLTDLPAIYTVPLYACCVLLFFGFPTGLPVSLRGRSMIQVFRAVAFSFGSSIAAGLMLGLLLKEAGDISRLWIVFWFLIGLVFLGGFRLTLYYLMRHLRSVHGMFTKRVVIVGYGRTAKEMHQRALQQDWFGFDVVAVYTDSDALSATVPPGVHRIDRIEGIHQYVETHHVHEIWIALPVHQSEKLLQLQYLLRNALVDVRFVPDAFSVQVLSHRIVEFLGMPAVALSCPDHDNWEALVKEVFDRLFALTALALLAPLFAVIAFCIKWSSPGPVFYKQARSGLNGKPFMIYKFRSMALFDADNGKTVKQAARNDNRITPIGRFLRRTSLDELPQFINVFKGEMSVVGPRPHAVQHTALYGDLLDEYMQRHRVKPGITGWAQIHGLRGETDTMDKMARRVQFDLHYIQHWCLWLDLKIIAWTAVKGWTGSNAY